MQLTFSFIIPVYNRPEETKELLESLAMLEYDDGFEVVIVEDGSTETSETVVKQFSNSLNINYFFKENSGPGSSRNYGMQRAKGNYFIILDSDCIIPPHYLTTVKTYLTNTFYHCYGGADAADEGFSKLQKAINYTMTSFFTTGGIRGNKKSIQEFEPRSFNMGISKEAFEATGGFGIIHPGEDPDLSQRIKKKGYTTTFLPNAYVYHKRRISWKKFYTQVKKFGLVRPILNKWHPDAAKITFWLPTLFVFFTLGSILLGLFCSILFLIPLLSYILLLFIDSAIKNKSVVIGFLSIIAVFVQFFGYGLAYFYSTLHITWMGRNPQEQFPHLFFK
ncbi:glycosyltransferase [Patiriisocius hiemis]|uniref:Glycosyltransferase n=1 Tax=Patiriisocius hiemis TaxID=3075604 RepID=A0ABU2YAD5_9FLAO|nr:glycosyltransferase [Constantimarinum sp. W242]MDT0555155.1 glycosyltransferase [Constantimarinum sp. W242]